MARLVTDKIASLYTGHPASKIRQWGLEGRITRYVDESQRRGGIRYDLDELHSERQDYEGGPIIRGKTPAMPTPRRGTVVTTRELRLPYGRLAA
ncbi:hypothetical protein [Kitasatospora kifunensis]|uniref:Uncharacterized protein n=1 Tax=Kitasatospora kifunensis TaxID=58351 RepID=A0A7W7QYU8_KITKI|nr:hypothetical protein [Kitasatospora kifunensis]MBB4922254.1 hypothetical protein [Kitasatospora kifunensis]